MKLSFVILAVLSLPILSSAASLPAKRDATGPGRYIVTLTKAPAKSSVLSELTTSWANVKKDIEQWDGALNGFATSLTEEEIAKLKASPEVLDIEEDGEMHALASVTQANATWGLGRISSNTPLTSTNPALLTFPFTYDSCAGAGVDIYVVDTGVRTTHVEFATGRASTGVIFGGYAAGDGNGHGTHCAGTAAGTNVGVAKLANIVSVRVLSDAGSGTVSNIISGVNWILTAATTSGRPSVVLMAIGGSVSTALDTAVTSLTSAGIHVVVAAGGSNTVENTSPARVPSAITVGATTILDARAPYSNYGSLVDIFAPGTSVYSSWYTSDTAYATLSGTSMAASHVAGVVAYYLCLNGPMSVGTMATYLQGQALSGVLTNIPSGSNNYLVHI